MFKKIRRGKDGRPSADERGAEPSWVQSPPPPPSREKIGWVSPAYSQSRHISLNPSVLEENRLVGFFSDAREVEFYRILRSRILKVISSSGGNGIMVTSALPGEGKTLTAINLAFTIAKEFRHTVLLVDCDLRQQNIHRRLGMESDRGLVDYLLDDRPLSEVMVWPGVEKVTVISGGKTVKESSELLGAPRMREMVADLKARYPERIILFDVPPVLSGADTLAFAPLCDHILFVVEAGRTPLPEVRRALSLLPPDKILGLVLNRQESRSIPRYEGNYALP